MADSPTVADILRGDQTPHVKDLAGQTILVNDFEVAAGEKFGDYLVVAGIAEDGEELEFRTGAGTVAGKQLLALKENELLPASLRVFVSRGKGGEYASFADPSD